MWPIRSKFSNAREYMRCHGICIQIKTHCKNTNTHTHTSSSMCDDQIKKKRSGSERKASHQLWDETNDEFIYDRIIFVGSNTKEERQTAVVVVVVVALAQPAKTDAIKCYF